VKCTLFQDAAGKEPAKKQLHQGHQIATRTQKGGIFVVFCTSTFPSGIRCSAHCPAVLNTIPNDGQAGEISRRSLLSNCGPDT
jgi:hypothetical protein